MNKDQVEKMLPFVFWMGALVSIIIFAVSLFTEDWWFIILIPALWLVTLWACYHNIPKAKIGVPYSWVLGRFWTQPDSQGYSLPIARPVREGIVFAYIWRGFDIVSREDDTITIPKTRYQIEEGSVFLGGVLNVRATCISSTRLLEMSDIERKELILADVEKIIRNSVLDKSLDVALNMRKELEDKVLSELKEPAKTKTGTQRVLFGEVVSYVEDAYGLEILNVKINDVDPSEEIQKMRDGIELEKLKKQRREIQLQVSDLIYAKFPKLSDGERMAALQVLDNETNAARKIETIEFSELGTLIEGIKGIIQQFTKKDDPELLKQILAELQELKKEKEQTT